jgi:uncharacterized protein
MRQENHEPIIDCDIHAVVPGIQTLFPYLPDHWREYITQSGFKGPVYDPYPSGAPSSARPGTQPPAGGPPGSDLETVRVQVLETWRPECAIINCTYAVQSVRNPDAAAALATAVNEWLIEHWLEKEPRLRASIVVPSQIPELAVREIDRVGNHPGFVQIFLPVRSEVPYGNRRYHPIYAAAIRHDLAVGMHFGGAPGTPSTPSGWPTFYAEEYAGMAHIFQSQLISLVCEGVFAGFPTLRMAVIEGGFTWLPSLMWRLDKDWKGLRREVPWVMKPPSEYIRDNIRLSTQPTDAPPDPAHLMRIIDQLGSDSLLMFSTDYPHWHFDSMEEAFPIGLPEAPQQKIMSENARAFYHL